jgi:hypothetical protein
VAELHLVRDLLDKQLVDRRQRRMGRVDGIVIEVRAGARPRVLAIEVGPVTLLRRISGRLARAAAWLLGRWGFPGAHRIDPRLLRDVGLDIDLEADAETSPVEEIQRRLRDRLVARLPGSGS